MRIVAVVVLVDFFWLAERESGKSRGEDRDPAAMDRRSKAATSTAREPGSSWKAGARSDQRAGDLAGPSGPQSCGIDLPLGPWRPVFSTPTPFFPKQKANVRQHSERAGGGIQRPSRLPDHAQLGLMQGRALSRLRVLGGY